VLALDHGTARTGAAVSDPTGTIARPLPAIRGVGSPDGRRALARVIEDEAPDVIVVGEPRLLSGRRGSQAKTASDFARRLRADVGVPVRLVDERLTTVEARRRRDEARGRGDLDSLAACVMLQSYLEDAP